MSLANSARSLSRNVYKVTLIVTWGVWSEVTEGVRPLGQTNSIWKSWAGIQLGG